MSSLLKKLRPHFLLKLHRRYRQKKASMLYAGDNVSCPICNSQFKEFATYGLDKRKNARCYDCSSLERHRLLWMYLQEKTDLFSNGNKQLLHFAPEVFFYNRLSKLPQLEYHPCDLHPELYQHKGNVEIRKVDILDIPHEDNFFDVILCNHVLEHIIDDNRAISELYRVMKSGGWAILQVPIDYSRKNTYEDFSLTKAKERKKAFGRKDHVRWYGCDYPERLRKVGFKVNEDAFVQSFSKEDLHQYGLLENEFVYFCRK